MKRGLTTGFAVALVVAASAAFAGSTGEDAGSEARFLKNVRPLTVQGRRAGEGYFSPDGGHFIFQSERDADNPFYQIYMLDLSDGETHRVSPGIGKTTCAFFNPQSERLLFASTHLDPDAKKKQQEEIDFRASGKERRYSFDYDEYFDIFEANWDGTESKRLTDARGYDAEAGYSPDGSQIVFCSLRDVYEADDLPAEDRKRLEMDPAYYGEIYIMDADGSNQKRLTDWPGYDGGPFFSPDGRRIIWRHFEESGMLADVYTMKTDGTDRRRLTNFGSMCWAPFYHPSGRYVIFTTNKLGFSNFELYLVDAQGQKEPVRVTFTDGFDGLPVFSPDGARMAWTSNRTASGESQIFIGEWNNDAALAAIAASPRRADLAEYRFAPEILAGDMRESVSFLASDDLEGRMTGTTGTKKASEYIAGRLKNAGIAPAGEDGSYFQNFPFTSGIKVLYDDNLMSVNNANAETGNVEFKAEEEFRPLAFTENEDVEGEVVFAGYGIKAPGKMGVGYDSYANLDVKDKVVLALRYAPEDVEMERRQELNLYAGLRYKALVARENGAKALLVATGPRSPNAGELVPIKFDQSLAGSGIVVASVSGAIAEAIFAGSGKTLEEVQEELDQENPHYEGTFALPGVTVRVKTAVEREKKFGRNVLAVIPPVGDPDVAEYIAVGAHYDHIGYGEIGSLAHKGEEGQIHNGADDNASGTSLVLELAEYFADLRATDPDRFRRGVIIGLWSGEELGIIGSSYFVENPVVPVERIVAYFNFDMVGRLRDNKLTLQAVGSSDVWPSLIEKRNVAAGFNLTVQDDPYLPTDVTAFYPKGVPALSFFTGSHEDYNRPTDDAETLDYEGMERIARFAEHIIVDVLDADEAPQYVKVEPTKATAGRGSLRAYLGTIPDYATEDVEGVKLSGVRAGGPADKAGIQGGDIIVELAGQKITNIYDYTYALDAVKIGEPVEIVLLRNNERVKVTVVPEARK